MNGAVKSITGLSLAGLIVLLSVHGPAFFEAMSAAWLFLLKLSAEAPLGLWSCLLALSLATASQPFLRRWVPALRCPLSRDFIIESAALVIGVGVMWAHHQALSSLLLGILVGLVSPYMHKGLSAGCGLLWRSLEKPGA